jgi:hypothetical protein
MDRDEREERHMDRFSDKRWEWSGTLYLPRHRSRHSRLFQRWIDSLKEKEGTEHFRWVRVMEHNLRFEPDQVQFLVGGLRNRCRVWEAAWSDIAGELAYIEHFDNHDQMHTYREMLRTMDDDGELDLKYKLR